MTSAYDVDFQYGAVTEAAAKQIQDLLAGKGTVLGSVRIDPGRAAFERPEPAESGTDDPALAAEFAPGTSFHHITTTIYVDGGGHVHAVLIDEHHTSSGVVLQILADVAIN